LSLLNIAAASALALYALAKVPATMYWVSSGLVVLWCMAVFLLIPPCTALAAMVGRRAALSVGRRRYLRWSYAFLAVAWLCLAPLSLFWGALFVHIWEPWPLSLAQGPDSDRAKAGFETLLGFEPDETIEEIYYRVISVRDSSHFLRFGYAHPAEPQRIVNSQGLVALAPDLRARFRYTHLGEDDTLAGWWTGEDLGAAARVFVDPELGDRLAARVSGGGGPIGSMRILWIDDASHVAYYAIHTF
jgi:hypothetical protein